MFYQYNSEPVSAVKLWAHATSSDMVHWHREPIALAPTPGGPDADGCWTGTAAIVDGKPTFLYTGVVKSTPEQATLRDANLLARIRMHGRRGGRRPAALAQTAPARHPRASRWHEGRRISRSLALARQAPARAIRITGISSSPRASERSAACVLLYSSADFHHWEYLHPMARGKWNGKQTDVVGSGEMWECPDFFPLDGKHVLIHSSEGKTIWQIGTLDTATMLFHAESEGMLDHGAYYAPKSQLDAQGNRILWGWITETRPQAEYAAAGWSGMMSLPRRLSIANGALVMAPSPEIASLRTAPRTGSAVKRLPTSAQEIRLALSPQPAALPESNFRAILRRQPRRCHPPPRRSATLIRHRTYRRQRDHRHRQRPARPPHLPRPLRRRNFHQSPPSHHLPLLQTRSHGAGSRHHSRRKLAHHAATSLVAQKHLVNAL